RFATGVTGRQKYLIGPESYGPWRDLLRLLLWIIVPLASAAHVIVLLATGADVGDVIAGLITTAVGVAIQITFWVTLVFVILDRTGTSVAGAQGEKWSPDQLPEYPENPRLRNDLVAELITVAVAAALLIGQQFWSFVVIHGERMPLLAPAEWAFWWPYFLGILAAEAIFALWVWRRGGWDWLATAISIALGLAGTIPLVWLAIEERFWNPAFLDAVGWSSPAGSPEWIGISTTITILVIFVIDVIDAVSKTLRAPRRSRTANSPVGT
ncbi:MAG TPA: hypothetical protein VGP24_15940, partial [Glaciihabitans sp.]|nr:hypothetical protein [Glaciihabitans sp.]